MTWERFTILVILVHQALLVSYEPPVLAIIGVSEHQGVLCGLQLVQLLEAQTLGLAHSTCNKQAKITHVVLMLERLVGLL